MVKTSGKINLQISARPTKGQLSEPAAGLLRYSPSQNFKGTDEFAFAIFNSKNEFIQSDTVIIIVDDDTTNLPCGVYPQDDWVNATGPLVSVDVLANDIFCGDSASFVVEIYRPSTSFPPHRGSASVVNNRIVYTSSVPNVSDTIIYRVSKTSDTSLVGFATLYVNFGTQACESFTRDDFYTIPSDSTLADSLNLFVLQNDQLCNSPTIFSLLTDPQHGEAYPSVHNNEFFVRYKRNLQDPRPLTDSLTYRVCIDQDCYNGRVRLKIN